MKKSLLFLVLMAFCIQVTCAALGSEAPENLIIYEMPETGYLPGAVMTGDRILLTGIPLEKEAPWAALLDKSGAVRWNFSEAAGSETQYLCPVILEDGTYTVLRQSSRGDADYDCARLSLDENGKLLRETPLWPYTMWMIPHAQGTYYIGSYGENNSYYPLVAQQNSMGEGLFALKYTMKGFTSAEFEKGFLAEDSLILSGRGIDTRFGQGAGLLYRIDLAGEVIWGLTSTADDPNEYIYSNDVCVSDDGQIIWIVTTVKGDETDDYPIGRSSTVLCADMDGETLWTYKTTADNMLDYVVPVSGGFLFGSRGLDLENCPYLGQSRLLFLTKEGHEKTDLDLPLLGKGSMELLGMTANTDNAVLCYGLLLEDPGFPDKPFMFELVFSDAEE